MDEREMKKKARSVVTWKDEEKNGGWEDVKASS